MRKYNYSLKKFFPCLFLICLCAGCSSSSVPVNLSKAKKQISFYYESGQYQAELDLIIQDAMEEFNKMPIKDSSAVVFDVDETALSNYQAIKQVDFGYVPELWDKWVLQAKAPAIDDTKDLYHYLLQKKIHIIFLSARNPEQYEATYKNLVSAGYTKFDTLIVRSKNNIDTPAGVFKNVERIVLSNLGYNIIGSVGDQLSDFQGENVGLVVKLPNYMYLTE
ncbi:MAG: HAD family acid phosphatase [Bacteroidota bacterium]|nr:HAD family acid phosphatase [Bacteroidota bacterium]